MEQIARADPLEALAFIVGLREHVVAVQVASLGDDDLISFHQDASLADTEVEGALNVAQALLQQDPRNVEAHRLISRYGPEQAGKIEAMTAASEEWLRRLGEA